MIDFVLYVLISMIRVKQRMKIKLQFITKNKRYQTAIILNNLLFEAIVTYYGYKFL